MPTTTVSMTWDQMSQVKEEAEAKHLSFSAMTAALIKQGFAFPVVRDALDRANQKVAELELQLAKCSEARASEGKKAKK